MAVAALLATGVAVGADHAGWPREQVVMAALGVLAAVLWVTEAVPAYATALIVIAAEIVLLTHPPGFGGAFQHGTPPTLANLLAVLADPVMLLFFSGLMLAKAAEKEKVDLVVAGWLLRPFAASPTRLLFGVVGVTGLFSMWMSNTATTAFMLTLVGPILAQLPPHAHWRKALVLAVPFSASIGAMATPISTPPNALALGYLDRLGSPLSFAGWMQFGVPLAAGLLVVLALLLRTLFPPPREAKVELPRPPRLAWRGVVTVVAFTVTALLWLTEPWHRVPAAISALLPVVALVVVGVIGREEINGLDWDILVLIGGGLSLGWGLGITGLDQRLAGWLPTGGGSLGLLVAVALLVQVLGTILSNTAVANLVLPIAAAAVPAGEMKLFALTIAFTASLTMALPVSGPPNAMAYARGELRARDMIIPGSLMGLLGTAFVLAVMWLAR